MAWQTVGKWRVRIETETKFIFPEGKDGKSMRITLFRKYLTMKHEERDHMVVFRYFSHRGQWYWHGTDGKHAYENEVKGMLTKMLSGDAGQATQLIEQLLAA